MTNTIIPTARRSLEAIAIPLLGLMTLGGCSQPKEQPAPAIDARPFADAVRQAELDWVWISGTAWSLGAIEGQAPVGERAPTLSFKADQTWMSGSTGCNTFTGSFVRRGIDGIEIGPLATTKKFCAQPEGMMQQEARLLHLLDAADSYRATEDTLILFADTRPVLLYYAESTGPTTSNP